MRGEDGVVGLYDGRGHLRGGVDDELQLGLPRELGVESVHEERGEAGAGPASERVEHDESLQSSVDLILGSDMRATEFGQEIQLLVHSSWNTGYIASCLL